MKSLKNRSPRIKHSSCITKINTAQFDTRSERFQPPQWAALQAVQLKDCSTTFIYSSWGRKIFSLSHARDKTKKKHLFPFVYRAQKLTIFLILFKNIIDIAATGSMQGCVSYMNLVMSLAHHRVSVAQW